MTFEQFIIDCGVSSDRLFEYGSSLYEAYMRLSQFIIADRLVDWFKKPNPAFENKSPLELVENGELSRIIQMLNELDYSFF